MKTIIIGATAAGTSAAAKAKRLNPNLQITVYEKRDYVSFGACGLPYYVGDNFNDANQMIARTVADFKKQEIEMLTSHEVIAIDFDQKQVTVKDLNKQTTFTDTYEQLMIATGANAIEPPIDNLALKNVYQLRTMADGQAIKQIVTQEAIRNVTVIGAGFIGLEIAEQLANLGKKVRIMQLEDRVLPLAFDPEITAIMAKDLIENGIDLHLSEAVVALKGQQTVEAVVTNKGEYQSELVVVATGVRPNTQFIDSDQLKKMKNGAIIVDNMGKTSIEHVYAAGDNATVINAVTNEPMYSPLATGANKLGRIVGNNLAGQKAVLPGMLNSAGVMLATLQAGRTGLTEAEAKAAGIDYKVKVMTDKNHTDYYPGQSEITMKIIYRADNLQIIGGQAIGKSDSVLRVDVLAAAIMSKMTTEQLGMLDLIYAPPFARTWDALNVLGNISH